MKNRRKYIFTLFVLLQTISLTAQTSRFKEGETLNVWATSGLNMRDKPDAKAAKIATIPYSSKVIVQPNIGVKIPFEVEEFKGFTVKGYWLLVKYGDTEGYVFDGFLSRLSAPDKEKSKNLLSYLEKEIGKIGEKYDVQIYDGKSDTNHVAKKGEKFNKTDISGFKQKIAKGIIYELKPADTGDNYKITLPDCTFFESYILLRMFFHTPKKEFENLDNREFDKKKKMLHLSPMGEEGVGCYFDIKEAHKGVVIDGYCGC